MHKLMCVFFSSNCVKSTTFSILHNYSRADVIALKVLIFVDFIIVFFILNTKKLGNFRKKNEKEGKSYGGGGGTNRIENHNNNNK